MQARIGMAHDTLHSMELGRVRIYIFFADKVAVYSHLGSGIDRVSPFVRWTTGEKG